MNFTILTLPVRESADKYIPIGAIHVAQAVNSAGWNSRLLDQDYYRYSDDRFIEVLKAENPDIIGISAVVSTAYNSIKHYSSLIKKNFPQKLLILGGAAAISSALLLEKCPLDLIVIGEGELTITDIIENFDPAAGRVPADKLKAIPGLAFLDDSKYHFTGKRNNISPLDTIAMPDFSLIKDHIDHFIFDPREREEFNNDPRTHEEKRKGLKAIHIKTSRGCTNRCTFCLRYETGWRCHSVEYTISMIKKIIADYKVGFFVISDECFGGNKPWIKRFLEEIAPLDVLWSCAGMRVTDINYELIKKYKSAGCVGLQFGIESGSDKILKIMEKNATTNDNLRAIKLTLNHRIFTTFPLVIGMPGETPETIDETIKFLKTASEDWVFDSIKLSINYVQALPGTPIYQYMINNKIIGGDIDGEEKYLQFVSSTDASNEKTINFTPYPDFEMKIWKYKIISEVRSYYYKRCGRTTTFFNALLNYYQRHVLKLNKSFKYNSSMEFFFKAKGFLKIFYSDLKYSGLKLFAKNLFDYLAYKLFNKLAKPDLKFDQALSLRKFLS